MARKKQKTTVPPHLSFDVNAYRAEVEREINAALDLMEKTWGFRPPITLKTETCLVVSADFNLKDFAHKGSRSYVRAETHDKRCKPREVARRIVGEVIIHQDRCDRCGTGLPAIYERIRCLETFLRPRYPGAQHHWSPPDAPVKEHNGHKYRESRVATKADVEQYFLTPANEVERHVFPAWGRKLDKLIAEWKEKEAGRPKVDRTLLPKARRRVKKMCECQAEAGCNGQQAVALATLSVILDGFVLPDTGKPYEWAGDVCQACLNKALKVLAVENEGRLRSRPVDAGDDTPYQAVVDYTKEKAHAG